MFGNNLPLGRSPTADVPMTSQERPIVARVILCEIKNTCIFPLGYSGFKHELFHSTKWSLFINRFYHAGKDPVFEVLADDDVDCFLLSRVVQTGHNDNYM